LISEDNIELARSHPCYDIAAHKSIGRIHLPVALNCNIGCGFCDRKVTSFYHTSRPGLSYELMKPEDAVNTVSKAVKQNPLIEVIGISGPGEPLYNKETFETLKLVSDHFPYMKYCVCTNGLLLPDYVNELKELNVKSLTVTINAVDPEIAAKINSHIILDGKRIEGLEAGKILVKRQLEGLKMASDLGFLIKVNCVLIPGINDHHVRDIACEVQKKGAYIFNIMPLIPLRRFSMHKAPSCDDLIVARERCESIIPIFRACKQCRADACGIPAQD
jgi:nitrogen fixation protein NifB